MYINDTLNCKVFNRFHVDLPSCENIWLNVITKDSKSYIVGVLYRHPFSTDIANFIDQLNQTLQDITSVGNKCVFLGDFNIDILKLESTHTISYLNMLRSNAFHSIVNKPTRVTTTSSTLINHILISQITPGILSSDVSDHFPTFVLIKNVDKKKVSASENTYYRCQTNFNLNSFLCNLQKTLSSLFGNEDDVDHSNFDVLFDRFLRTLKNKIDLHAPSKQYSRKQGRLRQKPWITKAILKSLKHKQKLYSSNFINGNDVSKQYYKKYSNLLTRIKERSKSLHYQNILNDVKHDSCGTWRVIKELLAASPKRSLNHSISLLETDGENLSNAEDIANTLNNYFSTIGEKLAKTIKKHDLLSYTHYLMTRISSSFF